MFASKQNTISTCIGKIVSQIEIIFVIDTTGSMGSYIEAMKKSISIMLLMLQVMTLNCLKVSIFSYKDYCDSPMPVWSCIHGTFDELTNFVSSLTASGGGDTPEATKTAMWQVINLLRFTGNGPSTLVVWMTDAPPHCLFSREINYEKEKRAHLNSTNDFDLCEIYRAFEMTGAMMVTVIPDNIATRDRKVVNIMSGFGNIITPKNNVTNIVDIIMSYILALMGENTDKISLIHKHDCGNYKDENDTSFSTFIHDLHPAIQIQLNKCDTWTSLNDILIHLKTDTSFREVCTNIISNVVSIDPMMISTHPIFGKIWRTLCCFREDENVIQLKILISQVANKNTSFREFLDKSYDQKQEIKDILNKYISTEYYILDDITHDLKLTNQEARSILTAPTPQALSVYTKLLARIQKVNGTMQINAEGIPLGIPCNVPVNILFTHLPHLVLPGFKVTTWGSTLIAVIAILSNNPLLSSLAKEYLGSVKGKWLHIDNIKTYPELMNPDVIRLVLRIKEFLTMEEIDFFMMFNNANIVKNSRNAHITLKIPNILTIANEVNEDLMKCNNCLQSRSFTLMGKHDPKTNEVTCGLCLCPEDINYGKSFPGPTDSKVHMTTCKKCIRRYQIVDFKSLNCGPVCHDCRSGNLDNCNTLVCSKCCAKYVSYIPLSEGNVFTCRQCKDCPDSSTVERTATLAELVRQNPDLSVIFNIPSDGISMLFDTHNQKSLFDIATDQQQLLLIKTKEPQPFTGELTFGKQTVVNSVDVVKNIVEILHSTIQRSECALCYEKVPYENLHLSCGNSSSCNYQICNSCATSWYNVNSPGNIYAHSAATCAFCRNVPLDTVMKRFNKPQARLAGRKTFNPLASKIYGWCRCCFKVKDYADRECAVDVPNLNGTFCCNECRSVLELKRSDSNQITHMKQCPSCKIDTIHVGGCWHMTCPCNTHWCWKCNESFAEDNIYSHMWTEHNSIGLCAIERIDDEYD